MHGKLVHKDDHMQTWCVRHGDRRLELTFANGDFNDTRRGGMCTQVEHQSGDDVEVPEEVADEFKRRFHHEELSDQIEA